MPKLTKTADGNFVEMNQPGMLVRFNRLFGGAPLEVFNTEGGQKIPVVSSPSGEGFQIVADNGQDLTQCTPSGLDSHPTTGGLLREEAFVVDNLYGEALYQVGGAAPMFHISVDKADDCTPPDPRGDHGWSTRYHDILRLGPSHYLSYGVPIYGVGDSHVTSGILLLGDEIIQTYNPNTPWEKTAAKIGNGEVAIKISISLKNADQSSLGGVIFANDARLENNSSIDTVYNARGYMLVVNKLGGIAVHKNGVPFPVPYDPTSARTLVNSDEGILLEVRPTPNTYDVFVNGSYRMSVARETFGPYNGYFYSCFMGRVKFHHRYFFDAGTRICAQYRSTKRNTLLQTLSVYREAAPFNSPFYRTALPVAFIHPAIRQASGYYDLNKKWTPYASTIEISKVKGFFAGRTDRRAGLFCKIHGVQGNVDAHALVVPSDITLNALSAQANMVPESGAYFSITSEWAATERLDLL